MQPVFPSLEGGGVLSVKKVKMKGFRLFSAVSKETGKDNLNNSDITKVAIKTTIKNNIITIEPFKMRVAGFRPKMQGQASFDGKLNLKFRLGLPPFGIFGIPMTITGTQEKPVIKLRRGSNNQPLTESTDKKDDTPDE
jgi:AsmA protein